jgi:hypothetical protein
MQSHHRSAKPSLDAVERKKRIKDFSPKADILLSDPDQLALLFSQLNIPIKMLLHVPYDIFKTLFDDVDEATAQLIKKSAVPIDLLIGDLTFLKKMLKVIKENKGEMKPDILKGLVILYQAGLSFTTVMQLDSLVRDLLLGNADHTAFLLKAGLPSTVFQREFAFVSCLSGNLKVIANAIQSELLTTQWLKDTLHMQASVLHEQLEELKRETATPRGQSFVASLDFPEPGPSPAVHLTVFSMLCPPTQAPCMPATELRPIGLGRERR